MHPNQKSSRPPQEDAAASHKPRKAILDASHPGAWQLVGGIPLTARTIYHLQKAGVEEITLLLTSHVEQADLKAWLGGVQLHRVRVNPGSESIPAAILAKVELDAAFLYFDTSHLIDPRFIQNLLQATQTTLAFFDRADIAGQEIRAGRLTRQDLQVWAEEGSETLVARAIAVLPQNIDPFQSEVRGVVTPYFMRVTSESETREATRTVIRSQQKHVMDLPAQYLHPPLANALTYGLCRTRVTPDMVTVAVVCVALLVTWLFWHGHFVSGALLTFAVDILDGVDGKLARAKLLFSKFGQHEDVVDYCYENSWYAALGVGLSAQVHGALPWLLAGLLIAADTIDNVCYTLAGKWYGKSIDLFSPGDALFRKIAGRRNIYGAMFIVGFILGYPLQTFAIAAFWGALTAFIHAVRLNQQRSSSKSSR